MLKRTRALIALILAVAAAYSVPPARAAGPTSQTVVFKYNLNATSETFCALGNTYQIAERVQDATSTTMTAVSGLPFALVDVGSMISGQDSPAGGSEFYTNSVVAKASGASITINTPVAPEVSPTLTSAAIQARNLTCGTGKENGAFPVDQYAAGFTVQIDIQQMVLAVPGTSSIDARVLCRSNPLGQWLQAYPILVPPAVTPSYVSSTVVGGWAVQINGSFSECRVGLKINAADDGVDTAALAEQVTVSVHGTVIQ